MTEINAGARIFIESATMPIEAPLNPRWFTVEISVFPPIPMVQANGMALAVSLMQKLQLTDIHLSDEAWEYRSPAATQDRPYGLIQVAVTEGKIKIEHQFPATGLERFERLIGQVIESISPDKLAPQMAFASVDLDYVVDFGKDSREAILRGLGLMSNDGESDNRIDAFNRPCNLVGLRLGFPAFIVHDEEPPNPGQHLIMEGEDEESNPDQENELSISGSQNNEPLGADWQARVTLVTLDEDPSKASIEIFGSWVTPTPWDEIQERVVRLLGVAEQFLRCEAMRFLGHFTTQDEDDET